MKAISIVLIVILLLVLLIGIPIFLDPTSGKEHYSASVSVAVYYSSNPVDILSGTYGIWTGTIDVRPTGKYCFPNLIDAIFPHIVKTLGFGRVGVQITGTSGTLTYDLDREYVSPTSASGGTATFNCILAGSYNGKIIVNKQSGSPQYKDISFVAQ